MADTKMMYGGINCVGTSCPELAHKIADYLRLNLNDRDIEFPNENYGKNRQ
jgi:hypothetical protein